MPCHINQQLLTDTSSRHRQLVGHRQKEEVFLRIQSSIAIPGITEGLNRAYLGSDVIELSSASFVHFLESLQALTEWFLLSCPPLFCLLSLVAGASDGESPDRQSRARLKYDAADV